mgnify:CR=1 FL=1
MKVQVNWLNEYTDIDVPTEHLDRVTSYVGAQDHPPSLTRLGSAEWARIKEKVKGATREMAQELLNLHASRQIAQGHGFSQDTVWPVSYTHLTLPTILLV